MKIVISVIAAHLLFIAALVYVKLDRVDPEPRRPINVTMQYLPPPPIEPVIPEKKIVESPPPPEPVVVETKVAPLEIPKPVVISEPIAALPKPVANPEPTPVPPKPIVKPGQIEKQKPTPKPVVTKETPKTSANKEQLIALMQKSLSQLNAPTSTAPVTKKSGVTQKPIGELASEKIAFETAYEEELISYLESLLALPQKGEVKVKLILKRDGKTERVEILKASSEENKAYIDTHLAFLQFPPFGSRFKGENSHTFTLTLKSR